MFQKTKAFSSFSVNDIEVARAFYQDTIGLDVKDNPMGFLELHFINGASVLLYPKEDHQPATFTLLNFPVANIDEAVAVLKQKGIVLENYREMDLDSNGVFRGKDKNEGPNIAWFKDPAGNILSVMEE